MVQSIVKGVVSVTSVSVVCDQVAPAQHVDDIDEVHPLDTVHQVDHKDENGQRGGPKNSCRNGCTFRERVGCLLHVSCWLLVVQCLVGNWLLAVGCCLLAVGCWLSEFFVWAS